MIVRVSQTSHSRVESPPLPSPAPAVLCHAGCVCACMSGFIAGAAARHVDAGRADATIPLPRQNTREPRAGSRFPERECGRAQKNRRAPPHGVGWVRRSTRWALGFRPSETNGKEHRNRGGRRSERASQALAFRTAAKNAADSSYLAFARSMRVAPLTISGTCGAVPRCGVCVCMSGFIAGAAARHVDAGRADATIPLRPWQPGGAGGTGVARAACCEGDAGH